MTLRLAVCAEMVYQDLPLSERIRRISDRGFDVEIWSYWDKDIDELRATGATYSSMTGYRHGSLVDRTTHGVLLETAEDAAKVAQRLGVPRLVVHPAELDAGHAAYPIHRATGGHWLAARDALLRLAELGERYGVVYCVENLNTVLDHPGIPLARAKDTLELVAAVDHPNARMMLDLYHQQLGEGNLITLVERALPWIGEIQVADVPGRFEPGTGEINYPAIAEALLRIGYEGEVGLEAWAQGDSDVALTRFRAAFEPV